MEYIKDEIIKMVSQVSDILGKEINIKSDEIHISHIPHQPKSLPKNKMGIYLFKYGNSFLKIGKVGKKSNTRFLSQHYNPASSRSNLAKSLLNDDEFRSKFNLNEYNVGDWIKENCQRIDIILDAELGMFALSLIETLLHYKYHPKFEG